MVISVILAGGKGTRMQTSVPKQFLLLKNKPIIVHTIEKFLHIKEIDKIYVGINKEYKETFKEIVDTYLREYKNKIEIVNGGKERIDTLVNILDIIKKEKNKFSKEDVIITHDAVRPFITEEKIRESIEKAIKYGCVTLAVKCIDTVIIGENNFVEKVLDRNLLYRVQTPQTFSMQKLIDVIDSIEENEKHLLTDACRMFVTRGYKVYNIEGSYNNIKITTKEDLIFAKNLL